MAEFVRAANRCLHRVFLWIAQAALIMMVVIVTLAVTMRYVFNSGFGWAEEVPRLMVTLFAFLAMAMGVRDHAHIGINVVYNLFPKDGRIQRAMVAFTDVVVLICGLFMLYYGTRRCIQMYSLPGRLPMTGLNTWWQYLPISLGGLVISFDSTLFLLGVLKRDDLLYTEPEVDYAEELRRQEAEGKDNPA